MLMPMPPNPLCFLPVPPSLTSKHEILTESPCYSANDKILIVTCRVPGVSLSIPSIVIPVAHPDLDPQSPCCPWMSGVHPLRTLLLSCPVPEGPSPIYPQFPSHTSSCHIQMTPSLLGLPSHLSKIVRPLLCSQSPCPALFSSVGLHTI